MSPFLYAMSLDDMGPEKIHSIVGQETSGGQYNVIKLDDKGIITTSYALKILS